MQTDGFVLVPDLVVEPKKTKPVSTEWLKGPKISKEELEKGGRTIERLTRPEWVKSPKAKLAKAGIKIDEI